MKKILIIVDMQNDFTTGVLGNAECAAVIPKIVDLVSSKKYDKIILTRDTHQLDYMTTQEGKKLPVEHCIENTNGWGIVAEIGTAVKNNYSSKDWSVIDKATFGSIYLGNYLRETYFIEQEDIEVDFCGVCTGICVISNVAIVKAALPETKVSVIENACACVTPASHETAINAMRTFQVDIK